jgi:RNA polymerase sigma-70 factor (ECF subfamily)
MPLSERQLVARARRRDHTAFAGLLERHQTSVYNLCYRLLGDHVEAEDAAQETFLRAYNHLHRYDPRRSLRTWLCAIAHHYCIDQLRRRRLTWLSLEGDPPLEHPALRDPAPGPEAHAQGREQAARIQRLLARLAPEARSMIVLHYWAGLSYHEIAAVHGTTVSAVKSRLHRSRAALATLLRAEATHPAPAPRQPTAAHTWQPV